MDSIDYLFIALFAVLIILLIVIAVKVFSKKKDTQDYGSIKSDIKSANDEQEKRILDDNSRLKSEINQIQVNTNKDLSEFKDKLQEMVDAKFDSLNKLLQDGLKEISEKTNKSVSDNFEKTNETFASIRERIAKIDEAQKSLMGVEESIDSFKNILENKKMRGNFGEFQLESILKDAFSEKEEIYSLQHTMSNGYIADVLLRLPDPLGNVVVDSKFPLDNYKKIYDSKSGESDVMTYKKEFKEDCKKHINDISMKYIIKGETAEQAMMFIPSEAVFAEIHGNYPELVDYSRNKKVWIVSPTTFMALLETIVIVLRDSERNKNISKILYELSKLSEEFERYDKRWEDFNKHLRLTVEDADKINTTTEKISNKFKQITNSPLQSEEAKEE